MGGRPPPLRTPKLKFSGPLRIPAQSPTSANSRKALDLQAGSMAAAARPPLLSARISADDATSSAEAGGTASDTIGMLGWSRQACHAGGASICILSSTSACVHMQQNENTGRRR